MAGRQSGDLVKQVSSLFRFGTVAGVSDAQLLERFVDGRDEAGEMAFRTLLERHGPMVLRVCRGVLGDPHAAEDALQVTFLVLSRKARSIRKHGSLASWLHGVAHHVALRSTNRDQAPARSRNEGCSGLDMGGHVQAIRRRSRRTGGGTPPGDRATA